MRKKPRAGSGPSSIRTTTEAGHDDRFLNKFIPGSGVLEELRSRILRLNSDANLELVRFVLIVGESGAGKNHIARVISGHQHWLEISNSDDKLDPGTGCPDGIADLPKYTDRLGEQMLTLVPDELAESLLFGHNKGAFTGAAKDSAGLFGDDGYDEILLDEIGDASPAIQAKLLGILEGRPFIPVGGTASDQKSCEKRVLMATNQDLEELVRAGKFRMDLFHRIRRHTVIVPPLRECPEALPEIATAIAHRLCPSALKHRMGENPLFSEDDLRWMREQPWQGNIREVEEVLSLWIFYGFERPLQEVAASRPHSVSISHKGAVGVDIRSNVRKAISQILDGSSLSPGTIGKFVGTFSAQIEIQVKAALHEWYVTEKPEGKILKQIFPNMTPDSIRTAMSRAKRQ